MTEAPTRPSSPAVQLQRNPLLDAAALILKEKNSAQKRKRSKDDWIPKKDVNVHGSPVETRFSKRVSNLESLLDKQSDPTDLKAAEEARRQVAQILCKKKEFDFLSVVYIINNIFVSFLCSI